MIRCLLTGTCVLGMIGLGFQSAAAAQPRERVAYGETVRVAAGETVDNVITMGGDAVIEGRVLRDVVTMGGDVIVRGQVLGDVVTMGGDLRIERDGFVQGDLTTMGGDLSVHEDAHAGGARLEMAGNDVLDLQPAQLTQPTGIVASMFSDVSTFLVKYGLLFLLGLALLTFTPTRLGAVQSVIVRQSLRAGAIGLLGMLGAVVAIGVLALSIIGIPAALVGILVLPFILYVGLAAGSTVVGAALPIAKLKKRPIGQLAAGVTAVAIASLVPYVGGIVVAIVAAVGIGGILITRGKAIAPPEVAFGPYRSPA